MNFTFFFWGGGGVHEKGEKWLLLSAQVGGYLFICGISFFGFNSFFGNGCIFFANHTSVNLIHHFDFKSRVKFKW